MYLVRHYFSKKRYKYLVKSNKQFIPANLTTNLHSFSFLMILLFLSIYCHVQLCYNRVNSTLLACTMYQSTWLQRVGEQIWCLQDLKTSAASIISFCASTLCKHPADTNLNELKLLIVNEINVYMILDGFFFHFCFRVLFQSVTFLVRYFFSQDFIKPFEKQS